MSHFSYSRLDFLSPSNYSSIADIDLLNLQPKPDKGAVHVEDKSTVLDSIIIMKTFLALRKMTSFTLDAQTFLQVFKDKRNKIHEEYFGFCLLKLEWHALNVLTLHLGFYMVPEKSKAQFGKALRKTLTELNLFNSNHSIGDKKEHHIHFECFTKNVVDRIFQIDQDASQSIIRQRHREAPDITGFLENLAAKNQYDELSKEFNDTKTYNVEMCTYHKSSETKTVRKSQHKRDGEISVGHMFHHDWHFVSDNQQTSKEVLAAIFKQRLAEGFIFISTWTNQIALNLSHFVKIIEGRK